MNKYTVLVLGCLNLPLLSHGHQPVFDMAPRWSEGYGFQIRYQTELNNQLENNGNRISNPNGLRERTHTTWLEGIYTFNKAFRVTMKVPYINKDNRFISNGAVVNKQVEGLGDIIVGVPLKYYFNRVGYTGNLSLTPSLSVPTGSPSGPIPLGRGTVDYGLSASFSAENFFFYTLLDFFTWLNTKGHDGSLEGNTYAFDWDLGIHPLHSNESNSGVFLIVGLNGRKMEKDRDANGRIDPNTGGETFEVVPTLVVYRKNVMWRTQYHIPTLQHLNGVQLAKEYEFQTGIGITF